MHRHRTLLTIVCVALTGLLSACSMKIGPNEATLSGVPQGTWKVGVVKDPETNERTIIAEVDSEKTLVAVLGIVRNVLDGGTGIPVMETIKVAGTTAGNLIQGFLKNLDPGSANTGD